MAVLWAKAKATTERNETMATGFLVRHEQALKCMGNVYGKRGCHDWQSLWLGLCNAVRELLLLCGAVVGEMTKVVM